MDMSAIIIIIIIIYFIAIAHFRWPNCFRADKITADMIVRAVEEDSFFGAIEVDIAVPDQWSSSIKERPDFRDKFDPFTPYEYFSEMCPIFLNTEIPMDKIGAHMRSYMEGVGLDTKRPRKLLVGGMRAEKILLASPLLCWYLNHGLKVSRVSNTY